MLVFLSCRSRREKGVYSDKVKDVVRWMKRLRQEVFMPLLHWPGEGRADVGHTLVKLEVQMRKGAFVVMAFDRKCTETSQDGHVKAVELFSDVPRRISCDNTRARSSPGSSGLTNES